MKLVENIAMSVFKPMGGGNLSSSKGFSGLGAFTLAEVLITLGIIGVVAAMTMPTLINQTNGQQYKAAFKKSLSAISQAVTLNVALDDISFADTVIGTAGSVTAPANGVSTASLLNTRMKVVNITSTLPYNAALTYPVGVSASPITADTWMFFNDGSMFAFWNANTIGGAGCSDGIKFCRGYIDVNGKKGPNKIVTCDNATDTKTIPITADQHINLSGAAPCTASSPTDIYPVYYYDQTIVPSTNAGRAVLYGK